MSSSISEATAPSGGWPAAIPGADAPQGRGIRRQRVQQELVAAGLALMKERGYEATTVDDIAAQGGVARRTFFRYFQSKEDLVLGWLDEQGAHIGAWLAEHDRHGATVTQALQQTLLALAQHYDDGREQAAFLIDLVFSTPQLRAGYHEKHALWQASFVEILQRTRQLDDAGRFAMQVQIAVVITAFVTAIRGWSAAGGKAPMLPWVQAAFGALAAAQSSPAA